MKNANVAPHQCTFHMLGVSCVLVLVTALGACDDGMDGGRPAGAWDGETPDAQPDPEDLPTSTIYGGAPVGSCGWPTTVSLGGSCTGTLVHPEVVIYAAHCGDNYGSVRLGERISGGSGRTVQTDFCEVFPGGEPGEGNDFAVCRLSEPVNDVPIVPIAMGCETDEIAAGKAVTLVGFGEANNGPYGIKRAVNTTISGITAQDEVSIGGGGKDTCQGDSGGPVYMQLDDGSWRVFGITSYGGACGGGGYYSQMHEGIDWFESTTGIDITPCHDADGTWNPTAACTEFPVTPQVGAGTWANGCSGGPLSGPAETCGEANGGGADQNPVPEPEVPACQGCQSYAGSLSGANDSDVQPNGNYYQAPAGTHIAALDGPAGVDFDLSLFKWSGGQWVTVASAATAAPDESITYTGTAGFYAWQVRSYSGAGAYTLQLDLP